MRESKKESDIDLWFFFIHMILESYHSSHTQIVLEYVDDVSKDVL